MKCPGFDGLGEQLSLEDLIPMPIKIVSIRNPFGPVRTPNTRTIQRIVATTVVEFGPQPVSDDEFVIGRHGDVSAIEKPVEVTA